MTVKSALGYSKLLLELCFWVSNTLVYLTLPVWLQRDRLPPDSPQTYNSPLSTSPDPLGNSNVYFAVALVDSGATNCLVQQHVV